MPPAKKVVWKVTPLFAEWISSPANPFFRHGVLSRDSVVAELGCGVSGLVALALVPRISRYVLTDQPYVARLVEHNVAENSSSKSNSNGNSKRAPAARKGPGGGGAAPGRGGGSSIRFVPLDWETDEPTAALLAGVGETAKRSFDAVLACDCIYNEALVGPFVSTCAALCRLRAAEETPSEPCVCVVAQQLRDPLVFEAWMARFAESFHVWRVPDELLLEGLRSGSGFTVHVGVLKEAMSVERS